MTSRLSWGLGEDTVTREVPAGARELASRLAALFESDSQLVERQNDSLRRLRHANDQLWSGLHPDALGLVYDEAHRAAIDHGGSAIAGRILDALAAGGAEREVERAALVALQQAHWAIHRALIDYQSACEQRRGLAVDVGELSRQLTDALAGAGWSEQAARAADVHELAPSRPRSAVGEHDRPVQRAAPR